MSGRVHVMVFVGLLLAIALATVGTLWSTGAAGAWPLVAAGLLVVVGVAIFVLLHGLEP